MDINCHIPPQTAALDSTTNIAQPERLWKSDDLAHYLGCSVREIRDLRLSGLPTIKVRHLVRFDPEVVKAWLRELSASA